jgi:hypothetical protein
MSFQSIGKVYRLAVDKYEINFRMRYAARFDHVFDRSRLPQLTRDRRPVGSPLQEKVEATVKNEPDRKRSHIIY